MGVTMRIYVSELLHVCECMCVLYAKSFNSACCSVCVYVFECILMRVGVSYYMYVVTTILVGACVMILHVYRHLCAFFTYQLVYS